MHPRSRSRTVLVFEDVVCVWTIDSTYPLQIRGVKLWAVSPEIERAVASNFKLGTYRQCYLDFLWNENV